MNVKHWSSDRLVTVFALLMCILNCLLVVFLLVRLDSLANEGLFIYGTVDEYLRLSLVFLLIPVVSSCIALVMMLVKRTKLSPKVVANREIEMEADSEWIKESNQKHNAKPNDQNYYLPEASLRQETETEKQITANPETEQSSIENTGAAVTCPSCGKSINKPITTLDFSSGKAKLVDVCPYCNHVLGESAAEEEHLPDSSTDENIDEGTN